VVQNLWKEVDRFAINWAVGIADCVAYWRRNSCELLAQFINSSTVTVIYHHRHHLETRSAIVSIWRRLPPLAPFGGNGAVACVRMPAFLLMWLFWAFW